LTVAGCRHIPVSYSQKTFPDVGTQASAGVGDQLITQGEGISVPVIVLAKDQVIDKTTVLKGRYVQSRQDSEYATFQNVAMKKTPDGVIEKEDLFLFEKDKSLQKLCISRSSCAGASYTIEAATVFRPTTLQQTLLYNGKIGNRITLSYREFFDNRARPDFTNEVAYDLSESKILGYRGARLEVISATNTELVYKIISGFSK
jgi:hypothetical protein